MATAREALDLMARLREKAAELSKAGQRQWTAADVERAIYAATKKAGGSKAAGGSKSKRKR